MRTITAIVAACTAYAACAERIEIAQNRESALYKVGEEAVFTVTVKDDSGEIKKDGAATWILDNFGTRRLATGKAGLADGNPFLVRGKMDEEGFMRLCVTANTNSAVWAVGYDVDKIRQNEPCPTDFDSYWSDEKARLGREVPLDARVTLDAKLSKPAYSCYRVNFATFNGKRVYGFMCVPKDSSKAPFRVRVNVPGAGPGETFASTSADEITLVMNVHTFEPEQNGNAQREHMNRQNAALAEKYDLPNRKAYCALAGIAESREDYWYHDVMLGINRAVDWVCARPDVDLGQVIYSGSSQGGGFGLFLTYLNGHFTKTFVAVCAITGHYGYKQGWSSGWPRLIDGQRKEKRSVAEVNAAYFDGVNFAARIKSPIRFIVGFADQTCPPANVYAAYNVCPSADKAIINAIGSSHSWHRWYSENKGKPGCQDIGKWLRAK